MSDASLNEEQLFDLLGNERRRVSLKYLRSARESGRSRVGVRELARHVAVELSEGRPDEGFEKSVYTTLCQTHLRRLDQHDVVDYDDASKDVEPGPRFDAVCRHMDETSQLSGVSVGLAYLVVSLTSVLLIGGDLLLPSRVGVGQISVILLNVGFVCVLVARYTGWL